MLNIDINSWHAKYYKWITGNNFPPGLCPYWWQMFFFVPLSPLLIPIVATGKWLFKLSIKNIEKKNIQRAILTPSELEHKQLHNQMVLKFAETFGKIFFGILILSIIIVLGIIFYKAGQKIGVVKLLILLLIIIGVTIILGFFINWLIKFRIFRKLGNSKFFQIPIESISGFYKNNCPRINWYNSKEVGINE